MAAVIHSGGDILCFARSDPLGNATFLELAKFLSPKLVDQSALSMHLAVAPLALVAFSIGPAVFTVALLLVLNVLADVGTAVGPAKRATAIHLVRSPLTLIPAPIDPLVLSLALDHVISKVAFVRCTVVPIELARAVLLTVLKLAFEDTSIRPALDAVPILLVVSPLAIVARPVAVVVRAATVSLVVEPLALIAVAFRVDESTAPIRLIIFPVADILAAVSPYLSASTIAAAFLAPLSKKDNTIAEFLWSPVDSSLLELVLTVLLTIGVILKVAQLGLSFPDERIFGVVVCLQSVLNRTLFTLINLCNSFIFLRLDFFLNFFLRQDVLR